MLSAVVDGSFIEKLRKYYLFITLVDTFNYIGDEKDNLLQKQHYLLCDNLDNQIMVILTFKISNFISVKFY